MKVIGGLKKFDGSFRSNIILSNIEDFVSLVEKLASFGFSDTAISINLGLKRGQLRTYVEKGELYYRNEEAGLEIENRELFIRTYIAYTMGKAKLEGFVLGNLHQLCVGQNLGAIKIMHDIATSSETRIRKKEEQFFLKELSRKDPDSGLSAEDAIRWDIDKKVAHDYILELEKEF